MAKKTTKEKVQQWFIDRNLQTANPTKQFLKLMEEGGELFAGVAKDNKEAIYDAVGDMKVVMTGMEMQLANGNPISYNMEEAELLHLVSQLGKLAEGILEEGRAQTTGEKLLPVAKEIFTSVEQSLEHVAYLEDSSAEDCFNLAYQEIKDRKGRMIDGVFVKEADLKEEKDEE